MLIWETLWHVTFIDLVLAAAICKWKRYFQDAQHPLYIKLLLLKFEGYSWNWKMFSPSMIYALTTADFPTC